MLQRKKKILIFDDDILSLLALKNYLVSVYGFKVEFTTRSSIINRLRYEKFDLICIDIQISPLSLDENGQETINVQFDGVNWRETGLEFYRRLRNGEFSSNEQGLGTPRDVPVIIFSALASSPDVTVLIPDTDSKRLKFLDKPYDIMQLIEYISELISIED